MRTLHQQAAASRRTSLLAIGSKHLATHATLHPTSVEKPAATKLEAASSSALRLPLTAGCSAHFMVLLLCWLSGAITEIAPSLLLSSLVGLTVFCLTLAFVKSGR
jgi:uncharacterized membrane protein YGL010W